MLTEIIKNSPSFIEKPARYLYASIPDYIRCGESFRNQYKFLNKSQWWTREQHEEYQMRQLNKLLEHAYKNVPYYTKVFDERGIKPEDINCFSDLKKLPYLTKDIIKKNLEALIAKNYDRKKLKIVTTSGTTRVPMDFYIEPKLDKAREWAFITNIWNRTGYDVKRAHKNVILRGNIPNNGLFEYKGKELILSSFQMTEENMRLYIKLIETFNPDFIQAYPSSINLLAKFIFRNNLNINLHKLKGILCSSENLTDNEIIDVEKAFRARVYNFYGHSEHSCLAGMCEHSSYFHIQSEYGYAEIINESERDVEKEDEVGEIVATGFNNYVLPFIRYKTGDLVVNTNMECSCGRNYKLIKKIEGRKQEYFIDKTNRAISATPTGFPLRLVKDKIIASQYVQNIPGEVILNIQTFEKITDEEIKAMKAAFNIYFPEIKLEISYAEHINRTERGKSKVLVQNLDLNHF